MALFQYEYLSKKRKKSSCIQAESLDDAKYKLAKLQKAVTRVVPISPKMIAPLPKQSLIYFTQELSKLLRAGLPLMEALASLEEKYQKEKPYTLILDLKDQVKNGKFFSEALKKHTKTFDAFYICMVENGERRGALSESLEDIYQVLNKQQKLKKKVISSLTYPAVLLFFCLLVLGTLLFYVVPSLAELFEDRPVQTLTRVVLSLSKGVITYKYVLLAFFSFLIGGIILLWKHPLTQPKIKNRISKLPVLRNFLEKVALFRFCKALSSLLKGGVPLLQGLKLSKEMMENNTLIEAISEVEKGILQGEKFSDQLRKSKKMPQLMVRLIALSEQGGNVAVMLDYICQIYEEEIERSLSKFTVLLQPILLIFLGAIVGVVLLSVLLPLTDISSFTSGL